MFTVALVAGHGLRKRKDGKIVIDNGRCMPKYGLDEHSVNVHTVDMTAELCRDINDVLIMMVATTARATLAHKITELSREPRPDLVVEFHWNGFTDPAVRGTECLIPKTWIRKDTTAPHPKDYAWIFQKHLVLGLRQRDRGVKVRSRLLLLNAVSAPPVITEPDFLSNPDVCRAINDGFLVPQVAYAHASAIYEIVCATR